MSGAPCGPHCCASAAMSSGTRSTPGACGCATWSCRLAGSGRAAGAVSAALRGLRIRLPAAGGGGRAVRAVADWLPAATRPARQWLAAAPRPGPVAFPDRRRAVDQREHVETGRRLALRIRDRRPPDLPRCHHRRRGRPGHPGRSDRGRRGRPAHPPVQRPRRDPDDRRAHRRLAGHHRSADRGDRRRRLRPRRRDDRRQRVRDRGPQPGAGRSSAGASTWAAAGSPGGSSSATRPSKPAPTSRWAASTPSRPPWPPRSAPNGCRSAPT